MPKDTAVRRNHVHRALDELSDAQLRVAGKFIDFLRLDVTDEATLELLANPKLVADTRAAIRDLRAGRRDKFVPFERVKRDVLKRHA